MCKAVLSGITGGAFNAVLITIPTAVVDIFRYIFYKLPQSVILLYPHFHLNGGGVGQKTIPPGFIFLPGMNVGIIPKGHRLDTFSPQGFNAAKRAGSTAAVQQYSIHICSSILSWMN